jgi:hypothetical protein
MSSIGTVHQYILLVHRLVVEYTVAFNKGVSLWCIHCRNMLMVNFENYAVLKYVSIHNCNYLIYI